MKIANVWVVINLVLLGWTASGGLAQPDIVQLDGRAAGASVSVSGDGKVVLADVDSASFVTLKWNRKFAADAKVLGGMWERTYGDSAWRRVDDGTAPRKGTMPWYFLVNDGDRTDGYGVMVQPNAFACWTVSEKGIVLSLDVRAGLAPVRPRGRRIELCTLVFREGKPGESAFAAGCAFCRMMCPSPRLPKEQVYGYNDWYCAYGNNTATNFLADAAFVVSLLDRGEKAANRPFFVVDDGWQLKPQKGDAIGPDGQWCTNNPRWGMAMDVFASKVKALDARPGLWYRPFYPDAGDKDLPVDPTDPAWERNLRRDLARFRAWGFELVKIDFITWDWGQTWGCELEDSPCGPKACAWKDDAHTGAETVKRLYRAMREAAGDMYIIGCNAIDHFAAGLFELQRTGDDTDGRGWARTRKMGPNTIGMRAIHNRTFYLGDGDCVGLVNADSVPWEKNRQWLDLVAKSGTSLFISWKRTLANDPAVADALSKALKTASHVRGTGEPLDWMETPRPTRWAFDGFGEVTYDWDSDLDYLKWKWREPSANPKTGLEQKAFQAELEKLVAERKSLDSWSVVKAKVFALGCDRAAIGVSGHDWYPAFASWHFHRNHPFKKTLWARAQEIDDRYAPGFGKEVGEATKSGLFTVWKDFCHCSPDWDRILALGFTGMKAELLKHWKETEYYKSKLIAIDAVRRLFDRLIAETEAEIVAGGNGNGSGRMAKELASLKRLRDGKPETAYDVLQFIYLFWVMCENFDDYQARTLGNIDRLLTPYYRADLAAGRTTEAEFRDQLVHFWWQWGSINNYWGQPVYIGGTKADGTTEYNDVSKIILDIHDELALPTPKMHLKIAKNTPDWVWRQTLDMMRRQRSLSFCGEEPIARVMKSCGYTDEEARNCIIWGCYEWGVRESANTTGGAYYNLLKNIELILADAKDGRFSAETFEAFKDEFYRRLGASAKEHIRLIQQNNAHLADVNPSNLFALSLAYSVEKGVEPLAGGTERGNGTTVLITGVATTVDAFLAVKEIVYERKEMSLAELGMAMSENWKGREELRLRMMRSKRKWGNNDPMANALGAELVKFCAAEYNGKPNPGGGRFIASGHTARMHIEFGRQTGATPDGRKAGEEMSKNLSPTMGADTEGVTALIGTLAALDARDFPGDFPLDVALLPNTVAGDKGREAMRTLIETYFANGGMVIQFNIQSPETLRDAQKHPEKYENLQVRVCGWNVRWNDIPKVEQDKFIARVDAIVE